MIKLSKNLFLLLALISIVSIFVSCQRKTKIEKIINFKEEIVIEEFDTFYDKFHKDSIFQISRIKFPLEGIKVDSNGKTNWLKENWGIMKTKIYDIDTTKFKIVFKKTEKSFYQKFWLENSGFWSEYKFNVLNNKWYLVYAVEQNL